jgi:hypothetical protein
LGEQYSVKLENNKTAILIGLGFSTVLTLIILRGVLFAKGFVGFEDAVFNQDMYWNRDIHLYAWRQLVGTDGFRYLLTFPLFISSYLFGDPGLFSKFLLFIVYTLIGTMSFAVVFAWLKDRKTAVPLAYAGALIGALVYTLNPLTTVLMYDFIGLFSYAFLPLTFYLTRSALRQSSFSLVATLKYAIILSLILIPASTMYYMFTLHIIVGVLTGFSEIIPRLATERRQAKRYLFYCFSLATLTVLFFVLLWAYFLLPNFVLQNPGKTEYRHLFISSANVLEYSVRSQLQNVIRGFGYAGDWNGMYDCSGTFAVLWLVSTCVVPILAFAAIIRKFKDRDVILLGLLVLAGIILSEGSNWPFGNQYLWVFSHFELPFATGGLYYPIRARPLIFLPYAFLSALTVTEILKTIDLRKSPGLQTTVRLQFTRILGKVYSTRLVRGKFISVAIVTIVCGVVCISSFPLFSGDARATMNPMVVPQPYQDMNEWLNRDNGDYRVAWLPPSDMVAWNPHKDSPDAWAQSNLNYLPARLSSKPVTSERGMGSLSGNWPAERDRLEQYIYQLINSGQRSGIGKLLAIENAKYIIYHDDILDTERFPRLLTDLAQTDDLTRVYNQDYIHIFENNDYQPYVQIQNKGVLVVGGLDSLGLLTTTDLDVPDKRSFVFLEQNGVSDEQLEDMLNFTDSIVFYGNKNLDDFALSSLGRDYYYPALDCWTKDYNSPWTRDFFYSTSWFVKYAQGALTDPWDFDLGLGIMYTNEANAELSFKAETVQGSYEIWVRNLVSDNGNTLNASIDGKDMGELNSYSATSDGFKWQRIGQVDFDDGQHEIVLKTTADGFNAVNAIAVVPTRTLEKHRDGLAEWMSDSNIKLVYSSDSPGPVDSLGSEPKGEVLGYDRLSRTKIAVSVNVSEPCILSFGESYNRSWIATDSQGRLPKIVLNSVTNGFLLEKTGTYQIILDFEMENHLNTGKIISGLTLGILLGTLALIYCLERKRKRGKPTESTQC